MVNVRKGLSCAEFTHWALFSARFMPGVMWHVLIYSNRTVTFNQLLPYSGKIFEGFYFWKWSRKYFFKISIASYLAQWVLYKWEMLSSILHGLCRCPTDEDGSSIQHHYCNIAHTAQYSYIIHGYSVVIVSTMLGGWTGIISLLAS